MSTINFFSKQYKREEPRNDSEFGVGDDGILAFTTSDKDKRVAIVNNSVPRSVQFTPIDHNIVILENGNERSMCDGMLYVSGTRELIFVELKTASKDWLADAISQLKSTIAIFGQNHILTDYGKCSAYAANQRHPFFNSSKRDECTHFRSETQFRLNITNRIIIK